MTLRLRLTGYNVQYPSVSARPILQNGSTFLTLIFVSRIAVKFISVASVFAVNSIYFHFWKCYILLFSSFNTLQNNTTSDGPRNISKEEACVIKSIVCIISFTILFFKSFHLKYTFFPLNLCNANPFYLPFFMIFHFLEFSIFTLKVFTGDFVNQSPYCKTIRHHDGLILVAMLIVNPIEQTVCFNPKCLINFLTQNNIKNFQFSVLIPLKILDDQPAQSFEHIILLFC